MSVFGVGPKQERFLDALIKLIESENAADVGGNRDSLEHFSEVSRRTNEDIDDMAWWLWTVFKRDGRAMRGRKHSD